MRALIRSVNHDGDSDITGAIAGNILGAGFGSSWIPAKWLKALELADVIREMADDAYCAFASSPAVRSLGERYPGW